VLLADDSAFLRSAVHGSLPYLLILRSAKRVSKDEARAVASWFETALRASSPRGLTIQFGEISMRLIGMVDSPYVRRVAVSLKFMGIHYTSEHVSVFRNYDQFAAINPVVKAPTLVTDDGTVLMDSSLILEHAERLVGAERSLTPRDIREHARSQRIIGFALAACEKTVQIVYERELRPSDKQHEPWLARVRGQTLAAYGVLERELGDGKAWLFGSRPLQADITTAVAWRFTMYRIADVVSAADFPALSAFSARAEALPEFSSLPLD
jgi:glutathione S-transferase